MWKELDEILIKKGLSPRKLAKETGIDESLISKWRNERQKPNVDHLIALSEYLDVTTDYLLGIQIRRR